MRNGKFSTPGPGRKLTGKDIINYIESAGYPAVSASMIADAFDVTHPTVNKRLDDLIENNRLQSYQLGPTEAYHLPPDVETETIESYTDIFERIEDIEARISQLEGEGSV